MGLAASQVRFLLLTARKDDVEGQMMTLSNTKLSLARESADISKDYRNALNAKKLVWTTDQGKEIDLTYDLLMKPNTTEDTNQYILTNTSTGKVILDKGYACAIGLGPNGNAGALANAFTEEQFVQKMLGVKATKTKIDTPVVNTVVDTSQYTTKYNDSDVYAALEALGNHSEAVQNFDDAGAFDNKFSYSLSQFTFCNLNGENVNTAKDDFHNFVGSICQDLTKVMPKLIGLSSSNIYSALSYAQDNTEGTFDNHFLSKVDNRAGARSQVAGKNAIATGKEDDTYSIDVGQVVDTILTYFDEYCAQSFGGQGLGQVGSDSTTRGSIGGTGETDGNPSISTTTYTTNTTYVTDSTNDANKNDVADDYEANYYVNLYYAINSYGWCENDNISDKNFMQSAILNGGAMLKQLQTDGSWKSESVGNFDSNISTESDQDAIDKAEAEYDAEKDQIDYKEKQIDLQMTNLDAERSALTTEMDSVKSIIDKNITQSFKMFQSSA